MLAPLTKKVKSDHTLCLELRGNYINVYCRGGSLLKVEASSGGYSVEFDKNYGGVEELPERRVQDQAGVCKWLDRLPFLKQAMDCHFAKNEKNEREFQQLLVRENNFSRNSNSTDYFVIDIEYTAGAGHPERFDLVAVQWPSTPDERKKANDRRLVIVEMKYGDDALEGDAGLCKHIQDIDAFLKCESDLKCFKEDMVRVFNQKRRLGLMPGCKKDLESFGDEKPILLLVLANHDPGKSTLSKVLDDLERLKYSKADLRIATASFFGYGLYDEGVHEVACFRKLFANYIGSGTRVDGVSQSPHKQSRNA